MRTDDEIIDLAVSLGFEEPVSEALLRFGQIIQGECNMEQLSEDELSEAKELLGDKVHNTIQRSEVAALLRKHLKFTGCAGRRRRMNALHERMIKQKESFTRRFLPWT